MNLYQITLSITSFFMLFLGLFVYTRNVKRDVNRNFAFLSASLSIWGFGMLALALVKNREDALACSPILYLGLVFGGPALLAFILSITEDKNKINHYLFKIGYVCSSIFFLLHLSGKLGGDVIYGLGRYRSLPGPAGPYFNLFLCASAFYSCYLLYKRYKTSTSGIERNRLGYLFLGVFVAVLSILTNILCISGFNVYPLFHLGLLFFNAMTAYAIVRYRLMDITIIIRRALVYSVLTFLATALWMGNVFIFSSFSSFLFGYQTFFSIGLTSGIIAFTFLPIRDKVQLWVDKAFFAQRREIEEVIHEFSLTVSSSFDREFILKSMFNAVLHVVEVEKIGVMIVDDAGNYSLSMSKGFGSQRMKLNPDTALIQWLIQEKRSLLRREANESHELRWVRDSLLKELDEIEAVLVIPLFSHNKLIGILSLGEKTSNIGYSEEEMFLLETLTAGAILAFENIRLLDNRINLMINTIDALCVAIESHNRYAEGHSLLVADYSVRIAQQMRLNKEMIESIKIASFLHDIGNMGVSEEILNADRRLTPQEFEDVKAHIATGMNIVKIIKLGKEVEDCILFHHERIDGSGYPSGLKGEEIPVSARILAVADTYTALLHERPYRQAMNHEDALRQLRETSGYDFDPVVVEALGEIGG
ncbi:MAG: HD domain-containing phosphohydrolase [Candidatus Desantisbacteria bacterium]